MDGGMKEGREGGRRPARRPQGLLGRGQPISLSLINSSRGDCNTAGGCGGRVGGRGGGAAWRGGWGGLQLVDEEKIGMEGKRVGEEEEEIDWRRWRGEG